ncbi:MAG: phage holin family protein [Ruminococcus sp.]|nr:phage holin family protein [Ruminococcus sp.]
MAFIGFAGSFLARLMGGFTNDLKTLIMLMAIDFITGLAVAGIFKKSDKTENGALSSKTGFRGIAKKCLALTFVLIAHRLDLLLGVSFTRTAVILAYIANELVSIIENAGLMGMPVPMVVKKAIDILTEKSQDN